MFEVLFPAGKTLKPWQFASAMKHLQSSISAGGLRAETGNAHSTLYPITLSREALRPGAVYVDPFSHVSMVAGWERAGDGYRLILADSQSTALVSIHRYVEGRLVYRAKPRASGFRWYRPLVQDDKTKKWSPATDEQLEKEQENPMRQDRTEASRSAGSFREKIEAMQDPKPRDAIAAFRDLHEAAHQELVNRVRFVQEGFEARQKTGTDVHLPQTPRSLFHAVGAWETHATPCKDLKLLGLLRTIDDFPAAVASSPARYSGGSARLFGEDLASQLAEAGQRWGAEYRVRYRRSDGSLIYLSLSAVMSRRSALEAAYNPNDCPEIRWGAPPGGAEASTCAQKVKDADRKQMQTYRKWFRAGYGCE